MRLPKTSRTYPAEIEELVIGKGDYVVGGARSPAFLELDNARHRRPIIFGEVLDTLEGYPQSAAEMFSGRQTDPEEWAVMWKEVRADGVCLRLSGPDSIGLVKSVADRTRLPVMVTGDTNVLKTVAKDVTDTIIILGCTDSTQSMELSSFEHGHVVMAMYDGSEPKDLCLRMSSEGAKRIITSLGDARMDNGLKPLIERIKKYRLDGINGIDGAQHPIVCDITKTWESIDGSASARRASMFEAAVALSVIKAGADMLVMRGPGAADMARVYGSELAGL